MVNEDEILASKFISILGLYNHGYDETKCNRRILNSMEVGCVRHVNYGGEEDMCDALPQPLSSLLWIGCF